MSNYPLDRGENLLRMAKPVLERYREYIQDTGGNEVEDLLTRDVNFETNIVVAVMQTSVLAQVALLSRLRNAGLLP